MKFQSIFHYLLLIVVIRNGDAQQPKTGSLSTEENAHRLANCGTEHVWAHATDSTPIVINPALWPSWLLSLNHVNNTVWSLGTMISPRHLLTSSEAVLYDYKTWRVNGQSAGNKCIDGTGAGAPQAVMVMEIEVDPERNWTCLIDSIADKTVTKVDIFSVGEENGLQMKYRKLTILNAADDNWLAFESYHEVGHRGGPILWESDEKWWLIGLGVGGSEDNSYGLKVSNLEKELCGLVGVCSGPTQNSVAAPVAPPTAQPPPPAQTPELIPKEPLTTPSNQQESAAPPPTSPPEPSPKAPPPRAPPTRRGKDDEEKDDEYEMFLERKKEKEEAAMYEDEDTDILISKDDYWFSGIDRCGGLGRSILLLCLFRFLCE